MSATTLQNNTNMNKTLVTKTADIKVYLKQELSQAKVQELKWKSKINRPSLPELSCNDSKMNKNRRKTESDIDLNIDTFNINTMEKEIQEYSDKKSKKHKKKCKKKNCNRFENKKDQNSKVDTSNNVTDQKTDQKVHKTHKNDKISTKKTNSVTNSTSSSNKRDTTPKKPPKNAFSIMMEARNNVIGSNIDGKDKPKDSENETTTTDDVIETKNKFKARKQLLEKWADKKGAKKRKLDDELRENYVKTTLDKRAKRLKKMLVNPSAHKQTEIDENSSVITKKLRTRSKRTIYVDDNSDEDPEFQVQVKKNGIKLAPLFMKQSEQRTTKHKKKIDDPERIEARQKFLQSGMPDKCIKFIEKQKELENYEYAIFPSISHVTQNSAYILNSKNLQKNIDLPFRTECKIDLNPILKDQFHIGLFSNAKSTNSTNRKVTIIEKKPLSNYTNIIKEMKKVNTEFPIRNTFSKLLKKNPKKSKDFSTNGQQIWSEKYKPNCSDDIIGNTKSIGELKQWLSNWLYNRERKLLKEKRDIKKYKYDADFDYDFEESDDSQNSALSKVNTMILVGPCGCGKTSTVYALANELNFNVIEINASLQRSGKKILNDIHEATQSRHFCENLESATSSLLDDDNTKLSLILIEDIDIMFSIVDDGFLNAVNNIIQSGKRPVIITSSDLFSDITQKYMLQNKTLIFHPLLNKHIIPWFQIVCTVEGLWPNDDDVRRIFNLNRGDIRKTLNHLQFLTLGGCTISNKDVASSITHQSTNLPLNSLVELNYYDNSIIYPINLFNIYWNLAQLLKLPELKMNETAVKVYETTDTENLEYLVDLHDNLAILDVAYTKTRCDIDSNPVKCAWQSQYTKLSDSLCTSHIEEDWCTHSISLTYDWTYFLTTKCIRRFANPSRESTENIAVGMFSTNQMRFKQKLQETYHNLLDGVSLSAYLGPRNLGTDYFPLLRQINHTEKLRESTNNKRSNRFSNYLKSLDIRCSDLQLELLFHTFA